MHVLFILFVINLGVQLGLSTPLTVVGVPGQPLSVTTSGGFNLTNPAFFVQSSTPVSNTYVYNYNTPATTGGDVQLLDTNLAPPKWYRVDIDINTPGVAGGLYIGVAITDAATSVYASLGLGPTGTFGLNPITSRSTAYVSATPPLQASFSARLQRTFFLQTPPMAAAHAYVYLYFYHITGSTVLITNLVTITPLYVL